MSHYQWVKSHDLPINSHKRWCFNVTPPVFVMPLVYTPKENPHPLRLRFYPWDPRGIFGDAFFVGHPLRVATSRSRDQELKMAQRTCFGIGIRSPNWSGETTQNSSVIFKAPNWWWCLWLGKRHIQGISQLQNLDQKPRKVWIQTNS